MVRRSMALLVVLTAAVVLSEGSRAEDPESLVTELAGSDVGEASLVVSPAKVSVVQFEKKMEKTLHQMKAAQVNWPRNLEKIRNGVVQLRVVQEKFLWTKPYRTPLRETIFGSGWFIDNKEFGVRTDGDILVVTNAHVAKQAASITVLIPELGQEPIAAKVTGVCVQRDIALLKIVDPKAMLTMYKARTGENDVVRMKLGDSYSMMRGAPIMAVGYPLGMKSVKASMGIVSGYQQFKNALYLSITAPINPGNSGGPLLNSRGEVVGINSAKFAKASGISFAIPSNQLRVTLDTLYTTRQFIEPELGLQTSVGTSNLNEYLTGLRSKGGVFVKDVVPGMLYSQAGGKKGDLLLAIDGHKLDRFGKIWIPKLRDRFNIQGLLLNHKIGARLDFHVYRREAGAKGKLVKLSCLYSFTKQTRVRNLYEPIIDRPKFVSFAGFVFMDLNLNLVEANLAKNPGELVKYTQPQHRSEKAVIISNIVSTSLAADDGSAKAGVLVKRVNGKKVTTMDELCQALQSRKSSDNWWTVTTAKSFSAFKVGQVAKYEKKVSGDSQHASIYNGCGKAMIEQ